MAAIVIECLMICGLVLLPAQLFSLHSEDAEELAKLEASGTLASVHRPPSLKFMVNFDI